MRRASARNLRKTKPLCGIVGYVGDPSAVEHVVEGLKRLEYRGYDSAGVATVSQGELLLRRKKGKLRELSKLLRRILSRASWPLAIRDGRRMGVPRTKTRTLMSPAI